MSTSAARDISVLAILGPSYCGSTVISYVLNTDPEIFGGSELRRLVQKTDQVKCDLCGVKCRYWTRDNIERFRPGRPGGGTERFYAKIADITGKRLIADSSKMAAFFTEEFISEEQADGVRFSFLIPVKHPVRFFASYIYNDYFRGGGRKVSDYDEVREALSGPERDKVLDTFLPGAIDQIFSRYRTFFERFAGREESPCFVLKHEDLASEHGRERLETLTERALEYRPALDPEGYASYEAHPIGGNRGPYWQARVQRNQGFAVQDPRFRYYREQTGVRRDQKFARILPRELIERLLRMDVTRELGRLLTYTDDELDSIVGELA